MVSSKVHKIFEEFWNWRIENSPEFATFVGIHTHDDKLESYSIESFERRKIVIEKYLSDANHMLDECKLAGCTEEDIFNLEQFIYMLNSYSKGLDAKGYLFPICHLDGIHIEFERLLDCMKQSSEGDYLKLLKRLGQLPKKIFEIIEVMKEGIKCNMTMHAVSITRVLEQLDFAKKEAKETVFFKPFTSLANNKILNQNTTQKILDEAESLIKDKILPAYRDLHTFLKEEYCSHLRPQVAISSLNGGKELYQKCLDYHLTSSLSPEEVHKIGLAEVERIRKRMEEVFEGMELKMTFSKMLEHMKEDSFLFENAEECLEAYEGIVKEIEPKLSKLFNFFPKSKMVIEPMSSSLPNAPQAYYYAGSMDGSVSGTFFLNLTNPASKCDIATLALHEGIPGHHFQASYMIEKESLPQFRRFIEDRRYAEAPAIYPLFTAYVEGWGLYSEYLGYELQMYDDGYLECGHLSAEMLRACRLVVDTGLHAFGWTRDQAVEYLLNNTCLMRQEAENEIDRYITWPGQACGYKIGELKIKSLRKQAEEALGSKFDIKEFHDVVLYCMGPLDLLEKKVAEYIEKKN